MAKSSPSQLRTRSGRISRAAYAVLMARARAHNTSLEIELDKVLQLQSPTQLEFRVTPMLDRETAVTVPIFATSGPIKVKIRREEKDGK